MVTKASSNVGSYLLLDALDADVAVRDRTGSHTYADLRRATAGLTDLIRRWDVEPRSRIALLSRKSFFWVAAYLAILRSGHIAVPLASTLAPEDAAAKARFVDCAGLLIDSALSRAFEPVLSAARHVADESVLDDATPTQPAPLHPVDPDDDAVLLFTSGTTSAPRAVRVSHGNIRANTDSIIDYLGLGRDDRMLVVLPFSYCYGASLLHTHLRVGASLSICDTFAFPETAVEMIREHECTGFAGVPSSYQHLLRASSFASNPLPSLRSMQQAGGRLPQPQIERVTAAQPQADLFVMYGATEATARLSYLPPELLSERAGSVGRGILGVTLSVVDDQGKPVGPGVVGEILARGDNITKGYWQDPEGSAAKFVDGALRTGDLGYVDEDGFVFIVDRLSDFIKSWGVRVSSQEIEDAVLRLPGVSGAAAVGRPDPVAGEAIVLFCVTDDPEVTERRVLSHCRATLARNLLPHEIRLLPQLPLNDNGKVLKSALKALALQN